MSNESEVLNVQITSIEIETFVKILSNNKAAGIDGIRNEMLKCSIQHIAPYLIQLFNVILEHEYYPKKWSKALNQRFSE